MKDLHRPIWTFISVEGSSSAVYFDIKLIFSRFLAQKSINPYMVEKHQFRFLSEFRPHKTLQHVYKSLMEPTNPE